jgi:MOSC domain-containing protein YiiM
MGREREKTKKGRVLAVNISGSKGTQKKNVERAEIVKDFGIRDDAHAGSWHRQVSLLAEESIQKMKEMGLDVGYGDFAENLTTQGIDLVRLPVGTWLRIGSSVLVEVTQIGKECHTRCAIFYKAGTCVMPTDGIFTRVLSGGTVRVGDTIEVIERNSSDGEAEALSNV